MRYFRSDDLDRDLRAAARAQQDWEDSLPQCEHCGTFIDDYVYEIDNELLCRECMEEKYKRNAEDYVK